MTIQWFPGHMTRAKREMEEKLKMVDMVIECRDSRLPLSSENPMIAALAVGKPKLIVLTKKDMSDAASIQAWSQYLSNETTKVIALDLFHDEPRSKIVAGCLEVMKPKFDRWKARGILPRKIKAMVVGIPNVGKSTLINQLAKKKLMVVADRPGVTMSLKWANVHPQLDVLDTPGVLWPRFEDAEVAKRLAWAGSIAEKVLPMEDLGLQAYFYLKKYYPQNILDRYGHMEERFDDFSLALAKQRHLVKGDEFRQEEAQHLFLRELKQGLIGPVCFEHVEDLA